MGARKLTRPTPPDQSARDRAIAEDQRNLLLQAGAGSGKTTTLVDRLQRLLSKDNASLSRIVAITFTDKAAGELKERLRDLCDETADAAATTDERNLWRRHRQSVDTAHIGTIHGFCSRLLRVHALRVGIDPLFDVLDESQAHLLLQDTMRRFVLEGLRAGAPKLQALVAALRLDAVVSAVLFAARKRGDQALDRLCPSAEQVIARWDDALEQQARRIVDRLRSSAELQEAARDLREIQPLNPEDRLAAFRLEMLPPFTRALDDDAPVAEALAAWGAIRQLKKPGTAGSKSNWPDDGKAQVIAAIRTAHGAAAEVASLAPPDGGLVPSAAALTAHFHSVLPDALEAYAAAKRERSAVDFDDQLVLARNLLRDHPDVRQVEQRRFDHILVDEFQDTDPLQREIIWYLAEDGASATCLDEVRLRPGKLFVVGDAKQSIYAFRGADVTVYNDTRCKFKAADDADATTQSLTANFRSQPRLIAFFNEFFAHPDVMGAGREGRPAYEAWYEPLHATRAAPDGGPDVSFILAPGENLAIDDLRERVADRLARYIAEGVREEAITVAEPDGNGHETWRPARWRDVMILLPTMTSVHIYERALRNHGVPYYVVAGRGFFNRPEIVDVVAWLRCLDEPRDEVSLARILRAPYSGVSDEGLYWLARDEGLAEGLDRVATPEPPPDSALRNLSPGDLDRARRAAHLLSELRRARHHVTLCGLIERILDDTALPSIVAARFDGARAYANLRKLADVARDFEAGGAILLSRFIEHVETLRTEEIREGEAPAEEEQGDAVTIMTVHKAKGLERPVVVVADLSAGGRQGPSEPVIIHPEAGLVVRGETADGDSAFPPLGKAAQEELKARDTAERRRLLYVALTRARDRLVISAPLKLRKGGSPAGGVWVDALFGVFGDRLLTAGAFEGETGEWSAEVIRADEQGTVAPAPHRRSLLHRYVREIDACEPIPGGDAAEEAAIAARMEPVPPDLEAKTRFTVTELAAYLNCPRRYELRYVRQLAPFTPPSGAAAGGRLKPFERGNVVHRALQRLGRGPVAGLATEVDAAMRECGLAGHGPQEVDDIVRILVRFTGSETWEMVRTARELRSEVPIVAPFGERLIEGQVDALLRDTEDELHIIDYKTGRAGDEGTRAGHEFQVGAYAVALERAAGRLPATVTVHYMADDERVNVDPAEGAKAASRQVEEAVSGIRERQFTQGSNCDPATCPYAWACQDASWIVGRHVSGAINGAPARRR